MNNVINFYEFRRHRKIKKLLRFVVAIGIITIFFVFAYLLIVTGINQPTEFPSYIEPKP
ncbi:hypothetical protein [Priestia megaterium]|jgi:hypothetical protein|uniref:hypothetical protein n=1 Tax=Priestia megaterium TaxID=1404 RepID=UPI002788D27D|nr:hypothetical protein [Priestia megaterium]MDQ0808183.1 L-cystine uptake protein TcyP (sodium:dicarboxylate symporter family) [Priestia megaterium]